MKKVYQSIIAVTFIIVQILASSFMFIANAQQTYTYYFATAPFTSTPAWGPTLEPIDSIITPVTITVPATTCPDTPTIDVTHFLFNSGFKARSFFTGNYSIEIIFKADELNGYNRIIDFSNGTSDFGIYTFGTCLNFYPTGDIGACDFDTFNYRQLVITRNSVTKEMNVYVNGLLYTNHIDSTDYYVIGAAPNDSIKFFRDDAMVPNEASEGNVAFIRMSDFELSQAAVAVSYEEFCNHITSIDETYNQTINVYPNPANDILNIQLSHADFSNEMKFDLVNLLGQNIKQIPITNKITSIDLDNIAPGIYFYQVNSYRTPFGGVSKTGKIVVE